MRLPRRLKPLGEMQGVPRWILISGVVIVAFFVILAIFAPLIAPYGFDQVTADGVRFPKQAAPVGRALVRHHGAVDRRAVPGDLGLAHGDRGGRARGRALAARRRPARA